MYVYGVSKITEEEKNQHNNKFIHSISSEPNIHIVRKHDYDAAPYLYENIEPYLTELSIIDEEIEFDKVRKDFKIPQEAEIYNSHYTVGNRIDYTFSDFKRFSKTITIYREDYLIYPEIQIYAFKINEKAYWRENDGLRNLIYKIVKRDNKTLVKNSGYYPLSDNQISEVNDFLHKTQDDQRLCREGNEAVVYFEWY